MIKAILFDIDGVLLDSKEANTAFYQSVLRDGGYGAVSAKAIEACFHLPLTQSLAKLINSDNEAEVQRLWNLAHDSKHRRPELMKFPDQLEHVLNELHKKYQLGIVTSRIKAGLDDLFGPTNIEHLFDVVVSFGDYQHPKPHPGPLLIAIDKLGLKPDEVIYIGDSHTDIEAAQAAGMRSIHLSDKTHEHATYGITHFKELLEVFDSIEAKTTQGAQ